MQFITLPCIMAMLLRLASLSSSLPSVGAGYYHDEAPKDTICTIITDRTLYSPGDTITISASDCHFEGCASPGRVDWYEKVVYKGPNGWEGELAWPCRALLPAAKGFGDRTITLTITKPGTYKFGLYRASYPHFDSLDGYDKYSNEFVVR
jgi:hypothetical protein